MFTMNWVKIGTKGQMKNNGASKGTNIASRTGLN
jgi:hypothetical protein